MCILSYFPYVMQYCFDVLAVNRKDATMNWMIFRTKPIKFSRMIIVMQTGQSSKPVW